MRVRVFLLPLVFLASASVGFATLDRGGAAMAVRSFRPAAPGEPTYRLSNFKLTYPLVEHTSGQFVPNPAKAAVSFDMEWVGASFPGKAQCIISVRNAGGAVIGTLQTGATSIEPGPSTAGPMGVDISSGEAPASADGACSAGERPLATAMYVLSEARIEPATMPGSPAKLEAVARWKDGVRPWEQTCQATLHMADGSTAPYSFTLGAPDGQAITVLLPDDLSSAASAEITCGPIPSVSQVRQGRGEQ